MIKAATNQMTYAEPVNYRSKAIPKSKRPLRPRRRSGFVYHKSFDALSTENDLWGRNESRLKTDYNKSPEARSSLTAEQEKKLFLRYNYAKYCLAYGSADRAHLWAKRAESARKELILANLPLAHFAARHSNVSREDYDDFISEGHLTIISCIEQFNLSRGYKFSTYACRALLGRFRRLIGKTNNLRRRFGTTIEFSMTGQTYATIRHREQEDDAMSALREIVENNSAKLDPTERFIVAQRYMSTGQKRPTLVDLGKSLGMSRESVRRLESEGLAKLRRTLQGKLTA